MKLPLSITCLLLSLTAFDVAMHEVTRVRAFQFQGRYESSTRSRAFTRRVITKPRRRVDLSTYGC